jgi:serine carboxypeptidase-like clade 2
VQDYQGLSFATVRGAGHMVPYTQPQRAFDLLQAFLQGGDPAPSQPAA